jgi:hypothetical protein
MEKSLNVSYLSRLFEMRRGHGIRRGLKITFVLCPENVYIVVRHEFISIFSFFLGQEE